jgi:uncharacterized membrane-anchored protein
VQRLLEIETYRMMALIALPLVQEHGQQISLIEEETAKIARSMSEIAGLDHTRAMLSRLSRLSADVEGITARVSYRLDATRAYFALVRRRIERLREERLERLQTIDEFMERRLAPAMQTCETAARRLDSLSRRLARASDLLRTQVDVGLQEQNRDLLLSMDRRARLQSRLQRTLEVISMVALTYYLAVLLTTILKAVQAAECRWTLSLSPALRRHFCWGSFGSDCDGRGRPSSVGTNTTWTEASRNTLLLRDLIFERDRRNLRGRPCNGKLRLGWELPR